MTMEHMKMLNILRNQGNTNKIKDAELLLGQSKYSVWNHNVGYRSLTFSQTYRVDNIKSEP